MSQSTRTRQRSLHATLSLTAITLLLGACSSSPVQTAVQQAAQQPARPAGGHGQSAFIGGYDANRDGIVTRSEYDSVRKQRFDAADKNHDGYLNEEEYVAEFESRLKAQYAAEGKTPDKAYENSLRQAHVRFSIVDRDRDGKFTWEEELATADKTFKGADTNGDGIVSKDDPASEERPGNTTTKP
jgi:hypothetical protein